MSTAFTIHSKIAQFLPTVFGGFGNEREAVKRLVEIHDALISLPTLAPSPKVNTLFEELVALVLANEKNGQRILALPEIASRLDSFRNLCAQGESALESAWAKRASMASNAKDEVKKHPYYRSYKQLVAVEAEEVRWSASDSVCRILFCRRRIVAAYTCPPCRKIRLGGRCARPRPGCMRRVARAYREDGAFRHGGDHTWRYQRNERSQSL